MPTLFYANVSHHRVDQPTEWISFCQDYLLPHQHDMSQQQNAQLSNQEGRIELALSAYNIHQFQSLWRAAEAFNVPPTTLTRRYHGITHRRETTPNCQKLTATEKQTIIRYILDLDSRGFALRLCEVADIADKLLAVRGGEPVGKNWPDRFVARSAELKMAFNRAKDR
jgi:hypothetical protein